MFKLLRKEKYIDLIRTIEELERKAKYYESATTNIDQYACKLRQQKYELELDLAYANESYQLLHNELKSQKITNRRLINLLYNPKKK